MSLRQVNTTVNVITCCYRVNVITKNVITKNVITTLRQVNTTVNVNTMNSTCRNISKITMMNNNDE